MIRSPARTLPDIASATRVGAEAYATLLLGALGLVSAAIYALAFVRAFPLLRLYTQPHQDVGTLTDHSTVGAVQFGGALLTLFVLYAVGWWLCRRTLSSRAAWAVVLGGSVVFSIMLCFVYPIGAVDLYDYRFTGHIVVEYGANPYLVAPDHFSTDSLLPYVGWRTMRSVYGPLWQLLGVGVSRLTGPGLLAGVLAYKAVTVVALLATILAIRATLLRLYPTYALAGTFAFAWCPLVLLETAVNGHNDIVMALCMVLCVLALAHDRPALAFVALSSASLVKYVAVLLVPLVALYVWQHYGRRSSLVAQARLAVRCVVAGIVPALLTYGIFWDGWRTVTTPTQQNGMWTTSPSALLVYGFGPHIGDATANRLALAASVCLLMIAYVLLVWRWRGTLPGLIWRCAAILWVYLVLCNPWFQPWYVIWLVALGALLPSPALFWRTWAFALMAQASYLFWSFLAFHAHWNARVFGPQAYETAMIYLPPIAVVLWFALFRRTAARRHLSHQ